MEILTFGLLVLTMIPLVIAHQRAKEGKKYKAAVITNIAMFFCCTIGIIGLMSFMGHAEEAVAAAAQNADSMSTDLGYLAAALATGLSCIGAGIAVAGAASSAIGATAENPKMLAKSLIFVALAEGVALYGLVISFSIIGKLG